MGLKLQSYFNMDRVRLFVLRVQSWTGLVLKGVSIAICNRRGTVFLYFLSCVCLLLCTVGPCTMTVAHGLCCNTSNKEQHLDMKVSLTMISVTLHLTSASSQTSFYSPDRRTMAWNEAERERVIWKATNDGVSSLTELFLCL